MVEETSLEFRFKKNRWNKKLSFRRIKHNHLMSEKYKKTCRLLNYVEHMF